MNFKNIYCSWCKSKFKQIFNKKYLSSDTLSKIARKTRFCRRHATSQQSDLCKKTVLWTVFLLLRLPLLFPKSFTTFGVNRFLVLSYTKTPFYTEFLNTYVCFGDVYLMTLQPIYGTRTSGTVIEPSAF